MISSLPQIPTYLSLHSKMPTLSLPSLLLCLLVLVSVPATHQQLVRPPPIEPPQEFTCERITTIELCSEIYNYSSFPNFRDHPDQESANKELLNFTPLIRGVCSNAIVHFLCSIYAPFCQTGLDNIRIRPCRELCEHVRSTCEQPLNEFNLPWPPHLACENFEPDAALSLDFCPPNITSLRIPNNVVTDPPMGGSTPLPTTPTPPPALCPVHLTVTANLRNKSYVFAGFPNCGMNCSGIYFSEQERSIVAPVFILFFAVICALFTLFAVATFLIDMHRFHYPERPIIFLSFCYLVVSIIYMVGAISKLAGNNNQAFSCSDVASLERDRTRSTSFILQRLPNSESTYKSASCVILFVAVYFFQMASAIWWIVLTLTWFLAAALKWGEEAVEKLWLLYHIIAWGVPAVQIILVLALRLVDGDQLSGLCSTGNANNVGLGVFMFLPLTFYLLVGVIFLVIGFTALVNIRRQVQRDAAKARKIGRLIIRVGLYSLFYITPNVVLLVLLLYELASREDWERAYVNECGGRGHIEECRASSSPSFAAFILKYIMLFVVGICSTTWIFSSKTFAAWRKLFCRCCASNAPNNAYDLPDQHHYDIPNPQAFKKPPPQNQPQYVFPEKHGDLSMQYNHPHTSV